MRVFDSIEDVKQYLAEREEFCRKQVAHLEALLDGAGTHTRKREISHHTGMAYAYNDARTALDEIRPGLLAKLDAISAQAEKGDAHEEATPESIQAKLREELKRAVSDGVIAEFVLRKGGRATIYRVDQRTKCYTESTLDTLTELSKERKRLGKG